MFHLKGTQNGIELWLTPKGHWVPNIRHAAELRESEAHVELRRVNQRNLLLDSEDRIEVEIVKGSFS